MRRSVTLSIALWAASLVSTEAASLRVSPILIQAAASANATITLRNQQPTRLNAQVRVFRWSQADGQDQLVPADDVVASPPIVSIEPNQDYVVRLQRTPASPVLEASYRVVVDELPNPNRQRNGTVAIVLRYIVPAFFTASDASQPRLRWSVQTRAGRRTIIAENTGDKRIQLTNLSLQVGKRTFVVQKGLAGYVLGHSAKAWPLSSVTDVRNATVVATSDQGAVRAVLSP